MPAAQGLHAPMPVPPVALLAEPVGHGIGYALPAGQKWPRGHTSPVPTLTEELFVAPPDT
jgi:hypothetical protein